MSVLGGVGKALGAVTEGDKAKKAAAIKSVKVKVKFSKPSKGDGEGRGGRTPEERRGA